MWVNETRNIFLGDQCVHFDANYDLTPLSEVAVFRKIKTLK